MEKLVTKAENLVFSSVAENNDIWLGKDVIDETTISILDPVKRYSPHNFKLSLLPTERPQLEEDQSYTLNEEANDPFKLVKNEIDEMNEEIKRILTSDHPVLSSVGRYFFEEQSGKKMRPTMVLLMCKAAEAHRQHTLNVPVTYQNEYGYLTPEFMENSQRRLAEITEMIHTASLLHDDVIDEAENRRSRPTVNKVFGDKTAILAGDFLLARSSICLARLRSLPAVELMSTAIEQLVKGEVMQMKKWNKQLSPFEHYLRKNYYKTGALMSNSCKAALVLGLHNEEICEIGFTYGKHLGIAFQLIDDILDIEGQDTGKPFLSDLKSGLATAPLLLAKTEYPELETLANRGFKNNGDLDRAVELIKESKSIEKTRRIAIEQIELALDAIAQLYPSEARDALIMLGVKTILRNK